MKGYKHLTKEERYDIYGFKQEGCSNKEIAKRIGKDASTVGREIKRNESMKGYRPGMADRKACERKVIQRKAIKLFGKDLKIVKRLIKKDWSPEQISGWLAGKSIMGVSHETIYKMIRRNKDNGGTLYTHMRHKLKHRKKYGSVKRHFISNKKSIDARPEIVDRKERIGDWEIDTVISTQKKGPVLLTMVDKKSKYLLIAKVESKESEPVTRKTIKLFSKHKDKVLTITSDNGKEFSQHEQISLEFVVCFYFAHAYHSWERGLNEHTNGLIRQYCPKDKSFNHLTELDIKRIADKLNNRPRKALNYKTPKEVFFNEKIALAS